MHSVSMSTEIYFGRHNCFYKENAQRFAFDCEISGPYLHSLLCFLLLKEDCIHCSEVMDMPTGIFSPPLLYFLWYILLWFLFLRPLTERGNFLSFSFSKLYLGNKARWPIYYALYGSRNYYHMRIYSVFYTILSYTWIMCFESSCKSFLVGFLASQWMS